jgi:hypothetical protein
MASVPADSPKRDGAGGFRGSVMALSSLGGWIPRKRDGVGAGGFPKA